MSELIRELFERHQAKLLNLDYEQLKQQFDRHEECFNKRYATFSCFEKEFDIWEACWTARQSEIDQLKKQLNGSEYLKEEHRKRRCELAKEIEKLKAEKAGFQKLVKSLRSEFDLNGGSDQVERQIELLEEALRGGDQNTKNSIQAIESNGNRGGDQNERGEHE